MKCRSRASRISGTVIPPAPPGVEGWTLLRPQNWGQTAAAHRSRRLRLPPGGVAYPSPRNLPLLARDCGISYPSPRLSRLPFENGCSPLYERKVTELPFRRGEVAAEGVFPRRLGRFRIRDTGFRIRYTF